MPFEIGPVLRFESRVVAGRKGGYALRVVTGLVLGFFLGAYFWAFRFNLDQGASPAFAKRFLAGPYTQALCIINLTIALLFAPAAAADAFSRDRVRGMLASVLTTEISTWRIVLETYAARLIPGFTVWLSSIPIALFFLIWCSLDPETMAAMEVVTLGSILLGVSIALWLSLWTRRIAQSLMWTYGALGAWLLSWKILTWLSGSSGRLGWLVRINPYFLLIEQWNGSGPTDLKDAWLFLGIAVALTLGLLVLTAATLRRVVLKEKSVPRRQFRSLRAKLVLLLERIPRFPGPSLDANPVLWREWRRARGSAWGRLFWIVYALSMFFITCVCVHEFWIVQVGHPDLVEVPGIAAGIGILAVAVRAGSAWPEKQGNDRNGLDVLLATPLSARTIVLGKWWGAFRVVPLIAILPTLAAVILASGAPAQPFVPAGMPARPFDLSPWERLAAPVVVVEPGSSLRCGLRQPGTIHGDSIHASVSSSFPDGRNLQRDHSGGADDRRDHALTVQPPFGGRPGRDRSDRGSDPHPGSDVQSIVLAIAHGVPLRTGLACDRLDDCLDALAVDDLVLRWLDGTNFEQQERGAHTGQTRSGFRFT